MREKEIVLKRKVVFEGQTEELWGIYPFIQFLNKKELKDYDDDILDLYIRTDSYTNAESKDIPIEDLKRLIQQAEDAGANYIQIDYHPDHENYEIYGSILSRPTPEEDEDRKKKERVSKQMTIAGKIRGLEEEIKKLKKEQKK